MAISNYWRNNMTVPEVDRRDCSDCISHLQHEEAIATLKQQTAEHDLGLKEKVPYPHFKWAFGIVISLIIMVSYMNYNTMNRVLDSNHSVETKVAVIEADVRGIRESLSFRTEEHNTFKKEILMLRNKVHTLDDRMDKGQ